MPDTQRHRLVLIICNFQSIGTGIVNNNQRDDAMQYAPYAGGTVTYEPDTIVDSACMCSEHNKTYISILDDPGERVGLSQN